MSFVRNSSELADFLATNLKSISLSPPPPPPPPPPDAVTTTTPPPKQTQKQENKPADTHTSQSAQQKGKSALAPAPTPNSGKEKEDPTALAATATEYIPAGYAPQVWMQPYPMQPIQPAWDTVVPGHYDYQGNFIPQFQPGQYPYGYVSPDQQYYMPVSQPMYVPAMANTGYTATAGNDGSSSKVHNQNQKPRDQPLLHPQRVPTVSSASPNETTSPSTTDKEQNKGSVNVDNKEANVPVPMPAPLLVHTANAVDLGRNQTSKDVPAVAPLAVIPAPSASASAKKGDWVTVVSKKKGKGKPTPTPTPPPASTTTSTSTASASASAPTQKVSPFEERTAGLDVIVNRRDFNPDPENALFFVIKSFSEDDVHKSIKYGVWTSTKNGNSKLDRAHKEYAGRGPVYLFFSVNASGQFCGVAEMSTSLDFANDLDCWEKPGKWFGQFSVTWQFVKDVPNRAFRHILNPTNDNKPVSQSRDTQHVPYNLGCQMLRIFKEYPSRTSLLDDFGFYDARAEARGRVSVGTGTGVGPSSAQPQPSAVGPRRANKPKP